MVSFRLSDAEYRAAEENTGKHGVRSVSALAKFALMRVLASFGKEKKPSDMRLALVEQEIRQIKSNLSELMGKPRRR